VAVFRQPPDRAAAGIVGVAMGTVLVPELTRALRNDDRIAAAHAESRGLNSRSDWPCRRRWIDRAQ